MSYLAPTDLSEALAYLAETRATIVAGCTDFYPNRAGPLGPLLDVTRLSGFREISEQNGVIRLGAATTWTDIAKAPLPPAFDGLKQAAREVGSVQIQNRGTVAGNICNASPAADGVPPLLVLDALIETISERGTRRLPLSEFITGVRQTDLQDAELVSAVLIPTPPTGSRSRFAKLGSRTHMVISIAMVAACLEMQGAAIGRARIAVGSCAPVAQRLPALESALEGKTLRDIAALDFRWMDVWDPLRPISDVRGTATYRLDAVAQLSQRVIMEAMAQEEQDGRPIA